MPRCFMAKKLKYPYEQWKQEQELRSHGSRSPSPASSAMEHLERSNELSASLAGSTSSPASESGQQQLGNSKLLY